MLLDRGAGSIEGRMRRRIAAGEAFVPTTTTETVEIFCPTERFVGRAYIALAGGPMFFTDFVRAMRRPEPEIVERASELRSIAEAIRVGDTWLAFLRTESWERIHPLRVAADTEVRCAA
jgi:hypothetical protein